MDFYQLLGYFSGLSFIKSDMDPTTLLRTAALVHLLDAILCGVIANTAAGNKLFLDGRRLVSGDLGCSDALFLLPAKKAKAVITWARRIVLTLFVLQQ